MDYVQKFKQILAIEGIDVKVHCIASLFAILLILIKILEKILTLVTWL